MLLPLSGRGPQREPVPDERVRLSRFRKALSFMAVRYEARTPDSHPKHLPTAAQRDRLAGAEHQQLIAGRLRAADQRPCTHEPQDRRRSQRPVRQTREARSMSSADVSASTIGVREPPGILTQRGAIMGRESP